MLRLVEDLAGDWHRVDTRIDDLSGEIDRLCERALALLGATA